VETGRSLEDRLLRDPIPPDTAAGRRATYSVTSAVLISVFIAYHLTAVLVHSAPASTVTSPLQTFLNRHAQTGEYLRAAGIARSWAVFSPDAPRQNVFTRVVVDGADGQEWDLGHEPFGRRVYPYLFYDRMGKINREMVRKKPYRLSYAGWVCREWERTHGGQPARAVRLIMIRTRVPSPEQSYASMGYTPRGLQVEEAAPEIYPCASTPHGQLPPSLRARYGLPPGTTVFQDLPRRTWSRTGAGGELADTPPDAADRPAAEPIE
jgi:hypothetical protein